jgi:hypothetical protein
MLLFSYCLEPIRTMLRLQNCILVNKVVRLIRVTRTCASIFLCPLCFLSVLQPCALASEATLHKQYHLVNSSTIRQRYNVWMHFSCIHTDITFNWPQISCLSLFLLGAHLLFGLLQVQNGNAMYGEIEFRKSVGNVVEEHMVYIECVAE